MIGKGLAAFAVATIASTAPAIAAQAGSHQLDLPAGDLAGALRALAGATGEQLIFDDRALNGRRAPALRGRFTFDEALARLLAGTGLGMSRSARGIYMIAPPAGEGEAGGAAADDGSADQTGVAEILVVGSRSQNVDIRRSEDDAQPYVTFSQEEIRNSNATNIADFLRTRLPQNAQRQGTNQVETVSSSLVQANAGAVDLRGLGAGQTLILVDGRRVPGANFTDLQQANVNGIPLSAIERIEVLPSTAGAIYGGTAIGGVVNLILRRDYSGLEARLDYGNTFDGATGDFNASLLGGFTIGSTRIMLRASRGRTADLLLTDRNELLVDAREALLANNPPAAGPPVLLVAATGNVCASIATGNGRCNSAPLVFDNGTALGASTTYVPDGYAGPASDGGAGLRANAGRYNLNAPPGPQALIQGVRTEAVGLNITQPVTDWLQMFADASWDRMRGRFENNLNIIVLLQANDPNNPFQQPIQVGVQVPDIASFGETDVETLRLNAGLIARLPGGWSLAIEQGWNRGSNSLSQTTYLATAAARAALAPFALTDVRLANLPDIASLLGKQETLLGPVRTTTITSSLRLAGPLFRLPGGQAVATLLAERRVDRIGDFFQASLPSSYALSPRRRQGVNSLYLEARLPVLAAANDVPLVHDLELQASVRYDRYETIGTTSIFVLPSPDAPAPEAVYNRNRVESVDYLFGLRYEPVEGVTFRASYSTGFLPPALSFLTPQTSQLPVTQVAAISDPRRGGEDLIGDLNGNVLQTTLGNPDLEPERSRSFSFGLVLAPRALDGLRISADYTDIRKRDEISALNLQQLINNEDRFPDRIVRGPNRPGDPAGFAGPIVAYDTSFFNVANTRVKAWDFQLDYSRETALGRFHPYVIATRQTAFSRALIAGDPFVSRLDFSDGPLRWRANFGLDWSLGNLQLGWNMQFYDGYRICRSADLAAQCATRELSQGGPRVPSQSYHDFAARYTFGDGSPVLAGTEIALGIQNLFDKRPPLLATTSLSGFYSGYGDIRLRRFTISLRRRFGR